MNIVEIMNHPAHYHLLKNLLENLQSHQHNVDLLIRDKDILKELVRSSKFNFKDIAIPIKSDNNRNKFSIIYSRIRDLFLKKI